MKGRNNHRKTKRFAFLPKRVLHTTLQQTHTSIDSSYSTFALVGLNAHFLQKIISYASATKLFIKWFKQSHCWVEAKNAHNTLYILLLLISHMASYPPIRKTLKTSSKNKLINNSNADKNN